MRRIIAAIVVVALGTDGAYYLLTRPDAVVSLSAGLEVVPERVDLGDILTYEEQRFEASVRNRGDEPLDIERLSTTCSCTKIQVKSEHLEPGESTVLTGTLRGKPVAGPFQHDIVLVTAKPNAQLVRLAIAGTAHARVIFSPSTIILHPDFVRDASDVRQVTVTNRSGAPVRLGSPTDFPRGVAATIERCDLANGESCGMKVEVDAALVTPLHFVVQVGCSDPKDKSVHLPVDLRPAHHLKLTPQTIHLGIVSKDDLVAMQQIAVEARGDLAASSDVKKVTAPRYLLEKEVTRPNIDTVRIAFAIRPEAIGKDLAGEIVIALRHRPTERSFELRIPIFGIVGSGV